MTDKTTFISFLLDETGSMARIKDDTIRGFNAYIEGLQGDDLDILFTLVSFNSSQTQRRCIAEPVREVAPLTDADYRPSASTPLIDATVKIIKATDEAVRARGDDPNVVIVIQTDGMENVSVEYDHRDLALLMKEKTAAGWEFVFLGADVDAFGAARSAGISIDPKRMASYSARGGRSRAMFDVLSETTREYARSGAMESLNFSAEHRARVGDDHSSGDSSDPKAANREAGEERESHEGPRGRRPRSRDGKRSSSDRI